TMVAGRVAQKVAVGVGGSSGNVAPPYQPPAGQGEDSSDIWKQMADYVDHAGRMASDVRRRVLDGTPLGRLAQNVVGVGASADIDPKRDPLNRRQRRTLAVIAAVVVGAGAGLMANMRDAFGL